jgi:hypothetical protein
MKPANRPTPMSVRRSNGSNIEAGRYTFSTVVGIVLRNGMRGTA